MWRSRLKYWRKSWFGSSAPSSTPCLRWATQPAMPSPNRTRPFLQYSANVVELVLLEDQVQAEHDHQPGQTDSGVIAVVNPLFGGDARDVEQRHVEDRDGHGHCNQHGERDGPQPPVVAVDPGKRR